MQLAAAALQRGDPAAARKALADKVGAGAATAGELLIYAQASKLAGDAAAQEKALDDLLVLEPRNINALIMRGDCHGRNGNTRAAASFYHAALVAASTAGELAPQTLRALERAEALYNQAKASFDSHLRDALGASGTATVQSGPRFKEALEILLEGKQPYFQEPTSFFYPGLPHRQFFETSEFPWVRDIESRAPEIREELLAVLRGEQAFRPYVQRDADRPPALHEMLGDTSWTAFHIWKDGGPVAGNAERCPMTVDALRDAPLPRIAGRSPMILFSLLRPGAHIAAHNGLLNTRLICHLPLIVPPGCRLRVGNDVRDVEAGKAMIFDDSIEHEAWNDSDEIRVVLLFEIWRPELSAEEREALTSLFEAITRYEAAGT